MKPRICIAAFAVALAESAPAAAYDVQVSASTGAQLYAVAPEWPGTILRRRYLQTLGLDVFRLGQGDVDPGDPELSFKLRMRLDTDFGMPPSVTTYSPTSTSPA